MQPSKLSFIILAQPGAPLISMQPLRDFSDNLIVTNSTPCKLNVLLFSHLVHKFRILLLQKLVCRLVHQFVHISVKVIHIIWIKYRSFLNYTLLFQISNMLHSRSNSRIHYFRWRVIFVEIVK